MIWNRFPILRHVNFMNTTNSSFHDFSFEDHHNKNNFVDFTGVLYNVLGYDSHIAIPSLCRRLSIRGYKHCQQETSCYGYT